MVSLKEEYLIRVNEYFGLYNQKDNNCVHLILSFLDNYKIKIDNVNYDLLKTNDSSNLSQQIRLVNDTISIMSKHLSNGNEKTNNGVYLGFCEADKPYYYCGIVTRNMFLCWDTQTKKLVEDKINKKVKIWEV